MFCQLLPALTLAASVTMTLAEPNDMAAIRRLFAHSKGAISEKFILVAFPGMILAGFYFVLQHLQNLASKSDDIAFSEFIAPTSEGPYPILLPPKYAMSEGFIFKCDVLKTIATDSPWTDSTSTALSINASMAYTDVKFKESFIESLGLTTTLDHGQAAALCESLCRGLAFTQGIAYPDYELVSPSKTIINDIDCSHRSSRHRKNVSWDCLGQGSLSVYHGAYADYCCMRDKSRSG